MICTDIGLQSWNTVIARLPIAYAKLSMLAPRKRRCGLV